MSLTYQMATKQEDQDVNLTANARLKWKLKGSMESQLCQTVFCWGRQVKEGFIEADTGEDVLQKQACGRDMW